jgi:NAD(P)-dependent dehydrogenase (short-subunit alcohol dehydrogenase family)
MFDGSTIVVTGGASGIGRAVATELSRLGARVLIVDRDRDGGERVASETGSVFVEADLIDPTAAIDSIRANADELHGLVNTAGINEPSRFPEITAVDWDRVVAVDARAPLFLIQGVLDLFPPSGGSIVNVTSIEAVVGVGAIGPTTPVYAAAKAGLNAIGVSLASQLGPRRIRINSIAPGFVHTPLSAPLREQAEPWTSARTPLRRWAQPEQIADAVIFFLSDDSEFITGTALAVDGGVALGVIRGDS